MESSTWIPDSAPGVASANVTISPSHVFKTFSHFLKVVYIIGILGNALAIVILRRGERRVRNRKHLLLMTSLAANDLVALVGMLSLLLVSETLPGAARTQVYCAARVVLRVFGIGSVCIAVTMALERYLALTRPFLYQKQVTYYVIRTALLVSWFWAALLTCAPIFGLGVYYDEARNHMFDDRGQLMPSCIRYREAVDPVDFVYAVVYVAFGTFLCIILVYCNLAVIRALYAITTPQSGAPIVRRVSKNTCQQRQRSINNGATVQHNAATAEEVAFSRLMATLSVLFMICWLPQMVTSALYLALGEKSWPRLTWMGKLSDFLMLLNYVLDPVLYVLMRKRRNGCMANMCRLITKCFKRRNHKTSEESMTQDCQQVTLVVSESSGAELKPLRSLAPPTTALLKKEDSVETMRHVSYVGEQCHL